MPITTTVLNRMADDNLAKQLVCAWYNNTSDSPDPVAEGIFEQMAAQGQSFSCASGDNDAIRPGGGYGFPFPYDSPHVTLVGGTSLTTSGPGSNWVSERVMNYNNYTNGCYNAPNYGSTGGISINYAIPLWQTNVSMSNNHGSTTMRNVPDVAMVADEIFVLLRTG